MAKQTKTVEIRALTVKEPHASNILSGVKTIETRTWRANYRGPLLLTAAATPKGKLSGHAFAIVELEDITPMEPGDWKAAHTEPYDGPQGVVYGWHFSDLRPIKPPLKMKGKQGLFTARIPPELFELEVMELSGGKGATGSLKTVLMATDELEPWDKNPKLHDLDLIINSIKRFGFRQPITVQAGTNRIIVGHGRWEAARALGIKWVPCIVWEADDETIANAYAITDNQATILGGWDTQLLADIFTELPADLFEFTGFSDEDISALIDAAQPDTPEEPPAIAPPAQPKSKLGEIYQLGRHRVMCGDSTISGHVETLLEGAAVKMTFTDPPYGIDYSGVRTQVVREKPYGKLEGDKDPDIGEFIRAILAAAPGKDIYICVSPINLKPVLAEIPEYEGIIIWKKPTPGLGYQFIRRYCEFIVFITGRSKKKNEPSEFDFWEIATDSKQDYQHGTQKPVALPHRAIKYSSNIGDNVLDLFGGSGSTLLAAEQLDRSCYTMEIDPAFVDVIIQRWEKLTGQQAKRIKRGATK